MPWAPAGKGRGRPGSVCASPFVIKLSAQAAVESSGRTGCSGRHPGTSWLAPNGHQRGLKGPTASPLFPDPSPMQVRLAFAFEASSVGPPTHTHTHMSTYTTHTQSPRPTKKAFAITPGPGTQPANLPSGRGVNLITGLVWLLPGWENVNTSRSLGGRQQGGEELF